MSRLFDIVLSLVILLVIGPVVALAAVAIWLQDFHSPIYVSERVGMGGRKFRFFKLRSMVVDADKTGVDSTSANDPRLTLVGSFVRKTKLDEFPQFYNVLRGDMSVVGPRPNVERETRLYSDEEKRILDTRPGITDFSSIVFSDLAQILEGHEDANIAYNQLVRPWKSRLSLFYVERRSFPMDLLLIAATGASLVSIALARSMAVAILRVMGAPGDLQEIAARRNPLTPTPPPGFDHIVTSRETS